jgi:HAD superfamily hydrolase (TIGR01459 family)
MTQSVPVHDGLSAVAEAYDAFILDLWGVLHDGVQAYPAAVEGLSRLKAAGKTLLILSNAPRPAAQVAAKMRDLGIRDGLYDHLMSSGEDTWRHLRDRPNAWYRGLGRNLYHLGPARDSAMHEGVDATPVADIEAADFILNTGLPNDEPTLAPVEPLLTRALDRDLPMICANPDKVVMRGSTRELCAGTVADRYAALGGTVMYHGKPHRPIYDTCFALLGDPDPTRVAAIGDSLHTDIAGANAMGMAGLFVTGGIHAESLGVTMGERPSLGALQDLYAREGVRPTGVLPAFRW